MKKLYPLHHPYNGVQREFISYINKIVMNQNEIIEWISQFQDRIKKAIEQDEKIKKGVQL